MLEQRVIVFYSLKYQRKRKKYCNNNKLELEIRVQIKIEHIIITYLL